MRTAVWSQRHLDDRRARIYLDLIYSISWTARHGGLWRLSWRPVTYTRAILPKYIAMGVTRGARRRGVPLSRCWPHGIELSADERSQLDACTGLGTLEAWLEQAAMASMRRSLQRLAAAKARAVTPPQGPCRSAPQRRVSESRVKGDPLLPAAGGNS